MGAAARVCLDAGANDLGGTLMNESISRAPAREHGQEFRPSAMEALIRSIGACRSSARRCTARCRTSAEPHRSMHRAGSDRDCG
jgi:FO synthase